MSDEDIGYLKRAVEDMQGLLKHHIKETKEERKELDDRLSKIELQLSVGATMVKTFKFVWFAGILLLTLKLGDIPDLWHKMFS
jgi:hypothetical protein